MLAAGTTRGRPMVDLSQRLQDALSGRYRIERTLGRGGMATVFLAEDLKHHRRVAIKVLDPEVAAAIGPERFLREIETVARLTHPHILPLHDSGAADGLLFYVMPYVEGESLRERLTRERQLPVEEALRIAREVADALNEAHAQGIVHRDIKPENVLLEGRHAVVADFGIARAVASAGAERLTATGIAVGTPAYMSPEQAAGSRDVDGRSDLYSLGCVLYEMLAGQPPFTGPTVESLIHQHLNASPRPVTDLRPAVDAATRDIVAKALAKVPADRFATTAEFSAALEAATHPAPPRVATHPARARGRRILVPASAVLVVALMALGAWLNWGPLSRALGIQKPAPPIRRAWIVVAAFDAPDTSVGDAVQDLVSTALDQSTIVMVVPRAQIAEVLKAAGRSRQTRVSADLARELAYRLGVRTVVEGRVARLGRGYAITAQAEDMDSSRTIASAAETAKDEDGLIPAADRIGRTLREKLGENRAAVQATRVLTLVRTPSLEVARLWRLAREAQLAGHSDEGIDLLRQAIRLDPEFAEGWGLIGVSWGNLTNADSAAVYYRRALSFPERLTESRRLQYESLLAMNEDDPAAALAFAERHTALYPTDSWGHGERGLALEMFGRYEEALAEARKMQELWLPLKYNGARFNEWVMLLTLGRIDEAISASASLEGYMPRFPPLANALVAGHWEQAESLGTLQLEDPRERGRPRAWGGLVAAGAQCARGTIGAARKTLERVLALPDPSDACRRQALRDWLLIDLIEGRLQSPPWTLDPRDTSAAWQSYRALRLAATDDTLGARAALRGLRHRRLRWTARVNLLLAEGLIDLRAGRFQRVVDALDPPARTRAYEGRPPADITPYALRWVVSAAWAGLGRPDSAAALCALALHPAREASPLTSDWFEAYPITLPFALQRMVMLETRLGRLEDARRHMQTLDSLATRPDAEFRPLLAEARQALESAEAMGRGGTAEVRSR